MTPSNFRRAPYGHITNQAGHFVIGLFAYVLLGATGGVLVVLIGAAYLIGWEWGVQRFSLFWDSVEDAAFVTAGAAFLPVVAYGQGPGMVITVAIWLAVGAWLRR